MPPTPKTEADLRAWEAKNGVRGVILCGMIRRKCVECDQRTNGMAETHCGKHGGKRQVRNECQIDGCTRPAFRAKGTLCHVPGVSRQVARRHPGRPLTRTPQRASGVQ